MKVVDVVGGQVWIGLYGEGEKRPDTAPVECGIAGAVGMGGENGDDLVLWLGATDKKTAKWLSMALRHLAEKFDRYDWELDRLPPDLWRVGMAIPERWLDPVTDPTVCPVVGEGENLWDVTSVEFRDGKQIVSLARDENVRTVTCTPHGVSDDE